MWIHLNHGDEGLTKFLEVVASYSKYILLEPQPWKCYQTAARSSTFKAQIEKGFKTAARSSTFKAQIVNGF
jgi:hypothetical protein